MAMDVQSVVEEKMEVFLTEAERLLRTRLRIIDLLFYFLIFLLGTLFLRKQPALEFNPHSNVIRNFWEKKK